MEDPMSKRAALLGYVLLVVLMSAGAAQSLSGTNTVDSGDIKAGEVKGSDIAANVVTGSKVKDGSIVAADLGTNAVTGEKVADGSITTEKLGFRICSVYILSANANVRSGGCGNGGTPWDVTRPTTGATTGIYCIQLPNGINNGSVTIDGASSGFPSAYLERGATRGCPESTSVTITTYRLTTTTAPGNVTGTLTDVIWHAVFF
jgi:hypothetical protein